MAKFPKKEKSNNEKFEDWMNGVELKGDKLSRRDRLNAEKSANIQRSIGNFVSDYRHVLSTEHKRILDVFEREEYVIKDFLNSYEQVHGRKIDDNTLYQIVSELDVLVERQFILIEDGKIKVEGYSPSENK